MVGGFKSWSLSWISEGQHTNGRRLNCLWPNKHQTNQTKHCIKPAPLWTNSYNCSDRIVGLWRKVTPSPHSQESLQISHETLNHNTKSTSLRPLWVSFRTDFQIKCKKNNNHVFLSFMISAEVPRKSYSHTVWPSLFPDEPICESNLTGVHTATNTAWVTWQSCAAFPLSCPLNWETFFSSQPLFLLLRENTSHWRCSADRWTGVPIHPCVQFYATDCYTDEGSGRAADWLCCSFDHVTATVKARTLMGPAAGERSLGYSCGNVSMSKTHTHTVSCCKHKTQL